MLSCWFRAPSPGPLLRPPVLDSGHSKWAVPFARSSPAPLLSCRRTHHLREAAPARRVDLHQFLTELLTAGLVSDVNQEPLHKLSESTGNRPAVASQGQTRAYSHEIGGGGTLWGTA